MYSFIWLGTQVLALILFGLAASVLTAEEAAGRLLSAGRVHRLAETDRRGARQLSTLWDDEARLFSAAALARALAFALGGMVGVAVLGTRGRPRLRRGRAVLGGLGRPGHRLRDRSAR